MIYGVAWADVAIFAVLALTTARGYWRGFIGELAGIVALAAALIVPFYYNGILDDPIHNVTGAAPPIAHIAGMGISSVFAYLAIVIVASIFGRIKKVPVLGFGDALAGAAIGLLKGAAFIWVALFIALFFPLNKPIRDSLHKSYLATAIVADDATIDRAVQGAIPTFVLPWVAPFFKRHHV